jgi:phosphate:Na+ symporter
MVIGFVDSSLMTLSQATGVIMGANVGTTLTGILFTFNIQDIVPFIIFIGTVATLFIKRKSFKHTGMVLLGFGILFLGLNLMSSAMLPLRESAFMGDLFVHTQIPIIGLLVGFVVTALIQSSTASIGILLAMVEAGIVTDLSQAIFILYGFNVGTVITVMVASIKANKISKQAAIVHVLFNVLGALIFTVITILPLGFVSFIQSTSNSITLQLVYAHIIFNVATMFILLPFSTYITKIAEKIITKDSKDSNELKFKFIDRRLISTPSIEVEHTVKEIGRMFELVLDNFKLAAKINYDDEKTTDKNFELLVQNEETIHYLHREINKYLLSFNTLKLEDNYVITVSICYKINNCLKRIQDLSKDLVFSIKQYKNDEKHVSGIAEIEPIIGLVEKIMVKTYELFENNQLDREQNKKRINEIHVLNKEISNLTQTNKELLIGGITYTRIFYNLERISARAVCIAKALEHRKD